MCTALNHLVILAVGAGAGIVFSYLWGVVIEVRPLLPRLPATRRQLKQAGRAARLPLPKERW